MKAQDEERRRIARELHDSAGQTLTVLGLSLAQLVERARVIAPELAKEAKEIEGVRSVGLAANGLNDPNESEYSVSVLGRRWGILYQEVCRVKHNQELRNCFSRLQRF